MLAGQQGGKGAGEGWQSIVCCCGTPRSREHPWWDAGAEAARVEQLGAVLLPVVLCKGIDDALGMGRSCPPGCWRGKGERGAADAGHRCHVHTWPLLSRGPSKVHAIAPHLLGVAEGRGIDHCLPPTRLPVAAHLKHFASSSQVSECRLFFGCGAVLIYSPYMCRNLTFLKRALSNR